MAPSTIPSCCLTTEQKDALIEAVHERPVIWDCSTPDYQDVQNRRAAFGEVADLLSDDKNRYSGPEMQVEWKKLRDIFNRTLKKVVANGYGDMDVTWRYWNKLQFIADHERSQIFKAMQKWSKKVPPSSASSIPSKRRSTVNTTLSQSQTHLRRSNAHSRAANCSTAAAALVDESSTSNSASMVQQLAEVAQTARELLGMENIMMKEEAEEEEENEGDEEEGLGGRGDDEEEHQEEEDEETQEATVDQSTVQQSSSSSFDPLGQILLLGSQIQQNSAENCNGGCPSFSESNGDLPKLLNEWLAKGAAEMAESSNGRRRKGNNATMNGNGTTTKRLKMEEENHRKTIEQQQNGNGMIVGGRWQQEGGGGGTRNGNSSDQFDIFGMFIASQVRTLHSNSPQCALRLKRALTELCFQFEAEQEE